MKLKIDETKNKLYPADFLIGKTILLTNKHHSEYGNIFIVKPTESMHTVNFVKKYGTSSLIESVNQMISCQIVNKENFPELYL